MNNINVLRKCVRFGYIDVGRMRDTVIVAGYARSGTTSVGDVVAFATSSRIIFEPCLVDANGDLALTKVRERNMTDVIYNFSLYLPDEASESDDHLKGMEKILSGKIYSTWTEQQARKGIFLRRLIKDVKMSYMLGCIQMRWPYIPIIYVIRDPLEVIASQMSMAKAGWEFNWNPEYITSQCALVNDKLYGFVEKMHYDGSLVSALINRWCAENIVACLALKQKNNAIIIRYKDLLGDADILSEVEAFMRRMRWPFSIRRSRINLPSFTSRIRRKGADESPRLQLTDEQNNYLSTMLEMYELNKFVSL